jgi:hypothetical protein
VNPAARIPLCGEVKGARWFLGGCGLEVDDHGHLIRWAMGEDAVTYHQNCCPAHTLSPPQRPTLTKQPPLAFNAFALEDLCDADD